MKRTYIYLNDGNLLAEMETTQPLFRVGEHIGIGKKEYEVYSITHILEQEDTGFHVQGDILVICKTIVK